MTPIRHVGLAHSFPAHANVSETETEYVIELEVSDFAQPELQAELVDGVLKVTGDQLETTEEAEQAFRLHERLEESFRLPDDVDLQQIEIFFEHGTLEIHAPKRIGESRRKLEIVRKPRGVFNADAAPC